MDQDESGHAGRGARPRPHCVRWEPNSASTKEAQPPVFVPCLLGQKAGWIKIPLGTEVALGPSDIVLNGDPAPPP